MVTLNWALEARDRRRGGKLGRIAADHDTAVALGQGEGRLAVVRQGNIWFAVRRKGSTKRATDLRYDFGLIALKVRNGDRWLDIVRPRPKTRLPYDGVGPILISPDKRLGLPVGDRLRVTPGRVVIAGRYRQPNNLKLRRGISTNWTYQAIPCGVRMAFSALTGETYVYSIFVPARARPPILRGRSLIAGRSAIRFSVRPWRVTRRAGYASSVDPALNRIRAFFTAPVDGPLTITICKR